MSVVSSTFGGVQLSADDAKKFNDQVTYGRPKPAAVASFARGRPLAKQYARKGYAIVKPRP